MIQFDLASSKYFTQGLILISKIIGLTYKLDPDSKRIVFPLFKEAAFIYIKHLGLVFPVITKNKE